MLDHLDGRIGNQQREGRPRLVEIGLALLELPRPPTTP